MTSPTSLRVARQTSVRATAHRCFTLIVLTTILAACGGGGGSSAPVVPPPAMTVVKGQVVDDYVEGATVNAYQVNADGAQGALIAGPVTTDSNGNYSLNLGSYSGPVYLTSSGGTYVETATGQTVTLSNTGTILSAIIPNASGAVTAEITPMTTMAAQLVTTVIQDSSPKITVVAAAAAANNLLSKYFGIANVLNTELLDLSQAGCTTGASPDSIDATLVLAAIGDLANTSGVSEPDLIAALIQDISSDGVWNGKANGQDIPVATTTGITVSLSSIEGNGLAAAAAAMQAFASSANNVCQAEPTQLLTTDLANPSLFSVPAAPTGVTATPAPGQVTVSWTAVPGATWYNLYVATATGVQAVPSGLPGYAIHLDAPNPYVLSGLTNGTTYYIVVTAVDGISGVTLLGSESAVSAEVSATPTSGSAISVSISPPGPVTVSAGGTINFSVTVNGSSNQNVTWSYLPTCGSVDSANVYTAPSPNAGLTCTLTATSLASTTAMASVMVTIGAQGATLTSIGLAPVNMTIAAGANQQFTATGIYSDGTTQNLTTEVTWASSDPSFATISTVAGTIGLATGVAAGTTTISASLGPVSAQTNLTVSAAAPTVAALSQGWGSDVCALLSNGTARCWGYDQTGSLGDDPSSSPVDVPTPVVAATVSAANPAKQMSMGIATCDVLTDGSIQCWGSNSAGALGNGTTTDSETAVTTYSNLTNPAKQVSVGSFSACGLFHDGTAACWGAASLSSPTLGLLGDGNQGGSMTSIPVSGITPANPATSISVGAFSACASLQDGTAQCWGDNAEGELGTGSLTGPDTCRSGGVARACSTVPFTVTGLSSVTMVSVGAESAACAVASGNVWCWGSNFYFQLGNGSSAPQSASPVQITGLPKPAAAVSVGGSSVCALLNDGTIWCWGDNEYGQMGNGTTGNSQGGPGQTSPVQVSNINTATAISVNSTSACALLQDGTVQCWGDNSVGEIGDGKSGTTPVLSPVPVISL